MLSASAVGGMLKTDALRMVRDQFLIGISVYILFVFALMRVAIPWMTSEFASHWQFDLTPYHPLIVSHLVVQLSPMIPGIIGGFLLLEAREDGTVKALLVSPVPLTSYVSVASIVMCVTGVLLTVLAGAIIGIALPPWSAVISVALAGSIAGPAFALLIAALSNNKVQAFAYLKIFGLGPVLASGAYFLPEPWQWLAAIYPPYWASKAYWVAEAGGNQWPLWVLGGVITSTGGLLILQQFFLRVARR